MIAVIDYGMGNLHSVSKAVERLGYASLVTSDTAQIQRADAAILPGVGAFGDAMENLQNGGLDGAVMRYASSGRPLLGICLGMQLLFTTSEEHGRHRGLDLLPGSVVRFKGAYKIPHMGWNRLEVRRSDPLVRRIDNGHVYFVHSFHVLAENREDVLATTSYHQDVTAVVANDNIYGMQFHPEKSGQIGMNLLSNFLKMTHSA